VLLSRTSLAFVALAALAASASPRPARAHGVSAEVDRREGAVAIRARYHGGRPLADARYEVRSPRGGDGPFAEGRTDRHGWLAFTPDVPGTWKVRIADASGHGRVVEVEVAPAGVASVPAPGASAAPPPPRPGPLPPQAGRGGEIGAAQRGGREGSRADEDGGVLRALAGAAAIAAVFGVLLAVQRARRARGR
jgi:nickel transport protein